jgi:hypothetical protein
MLVNIINASDEIISNAAILALEKILFMKDTASSSISLAAEPINTGTTFAELFKCLVNKMSMQQNIFAMRCFFRTIYLASSELLRPDIENLSNSINGLLISVIKNPVEDHFNYYLFETIATVLKRLASIDSTLYTYFENILKNNLILIIHNNITDLIGYAFQILSFEYYMSSGEIDPIFMVRAF